MAVLSCFSTDSVSTPCWARNIADASPTRLPPTMSTGTSASALWLGEPALVIETSVRRTGRSSRVSWRVLAAVFHDTDVDDQDPDGGVDPGRPRPSSPCTRPMASRCGRPTGCSPTPRAGLARRLHVAGHRDVVAPHAACAPALLRRLLLTPFGEVTRRVSGEPPEHSVALRPRQFGTVPADRSTDWPLKGSPDIQLVYLRRSSSIGSRRRSSASTGTTSSSCPGSASPTA